MLFAVGGIFMFNLNSSTKIGEIETEGETLSQSVDIDKADTWEKWSEGVSTQLNPFTTQTYFGKPVNVIDSAEDLAALSFYVQSGNTTYASAYYLVTADINLIGKLWTPIGTSSTPFSGQFYGGGHTISGIVVSQASSVSGSGVGLFGNVTGSLVDMVVDDLVVLNESDATKTGALAGHLSATAEVLNCYDLRANKSVYSSIGTAISGAKIYRGGSVDGVSADYTSQTAIYNAMTINTGGNTASTRYVVQYKVTAGNARFEKYGDSAWGTSGSDGTQTKVVKVALEGVNGTIGEVNAFAFSNNIPVLRYQAEGKNGQVYVINEEYRASISQNSVSKGLVNTITFSKVSTSLTINYGYGKNDNGAPKTKTATYVVPYDRPWKQYFDLTRTGAFDLEGIYKESSCTNKFTSEYIETFANGGTATLYLKWTAKTHTMTLNIGWSGADNSWSNNGSEENTPPQSPFVNGVTFTGIGTINPTSSAGRYLYSASSTGHTAGDIIKMEFWLKDGYTFTESISHKIVNGGGTISTTSPGVQTSFRAENIDSAQKTNYTVVKGTRVASGNVAYTPYTVTFEDVVETGIITLLIRQETINVTVKDTNSNRDDFSSNVLINTGAGNATETKSFSVQAGDYFHLKINANTGYYISNISIVDSNTGEDINNKFSWLTTTPNETYSVETSSGQKTYIQSYKIDAEQTAGGIQSGNLTITVTLESLPIYFNVEFDADNSTENTNNGNNFDEQGLTVNGVKNGLLSLTAKPSTSTNTGEVTFRVTENSIYEIDTMTISDGDNTWTINKTNDPNDDNDYTYVWSTNSNEATATISNFSYGITYTLKYTIKAKDYSLTGSVTIDGGAPSSDFAGYTLVFSKTENDFTSPITKAMPGDKIYWKLTMTNNLYTKRIAFSGVTVTNGASATNSTYENFTIDGSFTAGTSDVSVNVAFNTVTLTFTPSTNSMYIDNFNGEGSEVFIETNDPINKIGETALTATGHQGEYTVNVSTLTSISIYSGYYLVGWYIQNGETQVVGRVFGADEGPEAFFNDLFKQDKFLGAVSDGTTSFTLVPIYKQKTITVTGAFAESDGLKLSNDGGNTSVENGGWSGGDYNLAGKYYFDHRDFSIDISSIKANMRKAGYEQATGWNFASSTGVWTDEKPAPVNYGLAINNGADKIGASNDNIQGVDVWGSENSATLTINPVFGTKIEYNIIITGIAVNEDGEHLTASTTISVGDTITFTSEDVTSEGVYTISSKPEFSFADTPSIGHQFSSFTLKGNNSSEHEAPFTAENSNVVTLKLDISLFNTLVSESGYITDRNIFTAKTNQKASTYKIYLGYEGGAKGDAETVDVVGLQQDNDGYYVTVTYGTNADALASFTSRITRNGYTLVGFRERVSEGGVQYATYDEESGTWSYAMFRPEPAEDTTVYAVWQVKDEKYVSATLEGFTPYFNENGQVVIQGTVLAGENEIGNGTTPVGNGETITKVTITFADGTEFDPEVDQEVFQNGRQVALKDVRGEKTYIMIVTITDTLSANRFGTNEGYTYQIRSNTASGNILANAIVINNASIESYYTGSSKVAETANSVRGTLAFEHAVTHGGQPVTPNLSVDNATITIGGAEFDVAEGRNAIYDFNLDATQGANYGITAGQDGKYLIVVNGVLDIVPIELQFNMDPKTQTGFYMEDLFHRANIGSVTAYDKYNNELVSKFNFNTHYNYVRTNSDAVASYTANQFVIDGLTVSIGDTAVDPKNYTWTVVGTYNIAKSEDVANIFTYDARYLTATNGALNVNSGNLELTYDDATRIFNVSYQVGNGAKIAVQGSQISVADTSGDTLFTIIGNGTNDLSIAVKKDADVTFEISISGEDGDNLAFLGYFTTADISVWTSSQVAPLDTFTKEAENVYDLDLTTGSSSQQYVAVFTDARALYVFENKNNTLINSNDNPTAKIYLSSGDNVGYTYANPTMTGFTFDSWRISDSTVTANASEGESNQTFKSTGGSTPARAIAKWNLDKPVLIGGKKIEGSAYGGSDFYDYPYTQLVTFENKSDIVTYVFTWRKGDQVLGTGETYSFGDRNTSINGIYTITVTATYVDANGVQGSNTQTQTSEPAQFEFAIYKRELHSFAFNMEKTQLNLANLVYSNTDYIDQIYVNLYMYDEHHPNDSDELYVGVSLKDLLDNLPPNNPREWIEVTYGKENTPVTSIKNAGTYKISVKVGPYGFDLRDGKQELTLTVLQDEITLTQKDVEGLTKEFGASEPPAHTINYSINGESVPITLTRKAGESVGQHKFISASTTNANYTIADVSELYFEITPSTYKLQVSLDSALTYTYNKLAVTSITADYVEESEEAWFTSAGWYLFAYSEDHTLLATSKLSLTVNGVTVSTEVEHALDGFTFSVTGASANAGSYGLDDIGGESKTYKKGAEFAGSVPQASAIVVEKLVLKVTKATKEYDGQAYSTWSSTGTNEGLVVEFDPSSSILQGDTLSFRFAMGTHQSSSFFTEYYVGEYNNPENELHLEDISNENYDVIEAESCYRAILPSTKEVELKLDQELSYVYGEITTNNKYIFLNDEVYDHIKFVFTEDGSEAPCRQGIDTYWLLEITDATTSTGGAFDAGEITLTVMVVSQEYTLGLAESNWNDEKRAFAELLIKYLSAWEDDPSTVPDPDTAIDSVIEMLDKEFGNSYVKYFTFTFDITKKELSLAQTPTVTKEYDGNKDLSSTYQNARVGTASPSVWIGSGLVAGDIVTISGNYDSDEIGARTLSLTPGGDDGDNYTLTSIPAGQIASVEFNFTGHFDTKKDWVEDGVDAPIDNSFKAVYGGDYQDFVDQINKESNFGTRQGYEQTGWTFTDDSGELAVNVENAEKLVEKLLANGNTLTLNAVWSQKNVTITVNYNKAQGSVSGEGVQAPYSVPYFTGSLTLSVTANNGYFFEDFTVKESGKAEAEPSGQKTKTGRITLSKITDDITVQVNFGLIEISITASDGSHPDVELASDSDRWTDAHTFNKNTLTGTVATTLPQYTLAEKSYLLSGWKFEFGENVDEKAITVLKDDGRSIWEIIGGESLSGDSLAVTVTALWEVDSISFTITHNNATITSVMVGDEEIKEIGDKYTVHFGDTVIVNFEGNEGYKFSSASLEGKADNTTPGNIGSRTKASVTITALKEDGAVLKIDMASIVITINTVANVQSYSQINGSDNIQYQINYTDLTSEEVAINEKISIFKTTQTGTYNQTGWSYGKGGQSVELNELLLDFIKSTYASENPLEESAMLDGDYTLKKSLIAVWTAVEYTITLDDPQGIATDLPQESITVSYGQPINGLVALSPNAEHVGWENSWNTAEKGNGTTYQNGDNFQTPNTSVSDGATTATSTIYAVWTQGEFTLTITHDDEVTAISYNNKPVTAGAAAKYLSGTTHTFTLTITDGYVIDEDKTRASAGDSGLTISVNGDQILVANMTDDATLTATLNIVSKPETFRLNLDLRNGVESVSGAQQDKDNGTYYVNIDYRQAFNDTALSSLVFTRTGYTPDKIMLGEKTIATYADGAWSVVSDTYTLTTDSTIDVTWTLDSDYYVATMEDQKNNITYSAQDQTVANGKVTVGGVAYNLEDILPNGDIRVRYFFERDGGSQTANGTSSLVLRNVNQSGQYRFVLEIRDGVTNELVQIPSDWAQFTISEAEMSWSKGSFTSYYSGTSNFYATTPDEDMGHALIGDATVKDATFGRVVFTGSDYNIGSGKDVRVYINITADLAKNYSNIQGGSTSGYYLALTGAGEIVATPISFAINGGGFETGSQHEIVFDSVASTGVSTTSGVPLDAFTFSATFVTNGTSGQITAFNLKENSNTVLLSERSVDKDNFIWNGTGSYTISKASKTITLSGKVLSTDEDLTDAQNTITLSNVMYGADNVDLGNSAFYNHVVEGSAVFTISGNGSESVVIALGAGINISFDATTSKLAGFGLLDWTGDKTIATLKTTLQTLPKEDEYLQSYSSADIDIEKIYAVYTDLKYVRANYGYGENQGADYYVQIGQSTTLTEPAREGFNFVRWQAGAGVSVEGNKLSVASGETILPSSVTAIWEIANPTTASNNKELEFDAQYGANEEITLADVAGSITNQSRDLTYTYRWLKDNGEIAGNVDNISIARNTTASGNYTLEITASLPGYTSKTTTVNFTVTINKIALTAGNLSANEGTYKHADFASEVTIGVTVGSGKETPYTISSHLAKENFWFEISLSSEEVSQIFNAGTYTITLKGDDTVYNVTANSATFVVKVYGYELTSDDVTGLGKFFGEEDPDPITVTKVFTFGADNTESVQINFTRVEDGEAVGTYEVQVASISPTGNYSITAPKGNDFFEIRKAEGRLNITFDSPEALTKVYNGAQSTISTTFSDGKWTLSISDSASTTVSSGLTLKVYNNGREYDLSGIALENAFTGISFTFGEGVIAKNANTYPISVKVATEGTVNYQEAQIINPTSFVIGKANLVVSGITKEFDRKNSFSQAISGVGGERVTVTGQFAQVTVGSDIELNSVAILATETDNVNNYTISEIQTGSITPSSEANFDFIAGEDEFTYGDLRADDSLQTILEKLGEGSRFTIGVNYTGAIEEGYAQITSADYGTKTVSTGGYLIAGGNKVTLTITSENYAQLASGKTFDVSISIAKRALDLSGTQISKEYDQTDALPAGIVWSMQGNLPGDDVTVDESASKFENASVADDKKINIELKGNDKDNYSLAEEAMPKGNITPSSINIKVDGTTLLDRDFSSITSVDGEKVNIPSPSFNVEYTDKVNGQSILDSFRAPTRVGFTPSGWYYLSGEEYIQITAENMQSVLNGAFDNNKAVTIYAGWTIDRLDITLSVTNGTASVSAEESANLVDNKDGTYSVNYFSTITVKVTGAEGYKLDNITYSGNAQAFTPTGVGTKNDGQAKISQIRTGGTITISMAEIMINVTVNGNTPAFVDEVTLSGEGWDDYAQSIAYNDAGVQASTFLPQWSAPEGTYNFAGYTYGEGSTSVAGQTLKEIVGQANEDVNISFTASWTGVKYSIHFNVTENGSLSGEETIDNLVFGQELDFEFPVATLSGRVSIWNTSADGEGRVYGKGSYLQDVGTLSQDVYVLELYTVWANRTSTLTINVGENVTRVLAGRDEVTPENKTFELEYGVDSLIITITLKAGYELAYTYPENASNEIVVSGNTITISNMADNRELTIKGTARTNTLTLNMTNAIVKEVTSGTQGIGVVTAPTGDTVSITFAPTKGYSFVDGQSTISLSGHGKIQSTYQDGKVTVTWSDFTGDASLTVSSTPNKNEVTFSDNSAKVTSIWANGQSVSVTGGSAVVLTGETLTIVVNLRYGYHNASLTLPEGITASVTPQDETFDDQTRTYRRSFTITGIDENVAVTISASEREYSVQSISENADLGSVGSDEVVTMKFGSSQGFTANASEGYVFAGWYIGDTLISTDNPYTFFANESAREYLENNLTEGVLQLVAHFGLAESEVTITNGVNGTLTYNWGGEEDEDKTLVENDATTGIVSFGNKLVISVKPNIGYSVTSDSIKFTKEGQPVENAWTKYVQADEDGSAVITIPVEAGVPDKIEVTYVANDIEVYVQGVLIMGGAKNYGTNVGGQILLTNEDGEVVDWATENTYLDPNDEIGLVEGGNYRLATKTDTTLYFKATIKEGYTFFIGKDIIPGMPDAVINEISRTANEVFFSISRVSEGLRIRGMFEAQSNLVTVKFQTEDGTGVPAGAISVDTSSPLINAPINNSSSIYFYAVTSAKASFTINIGFNYSLKMTSDGIATSISEGLADKVAFGEVTDPGFNTGFTQRVKVDVDSIDSNGEIIIYVTPKVYNLNFVSEGEVLASISGITYGQTFSIPQDVLSKILVEREGYSLLGYYVYEEGQGTRYVNEDGTVPSGITWNESGYSWNGTTYVVSSNFDQATQTFSLYAGWSFDKEKVTIDFIPPELKGLVEISIKDIIYNLGADTSWTYANDNYYAEILEGVEIGLRAYPFEGFTFVKWIVNRDGHEVTHTTEEINYISEPGNVTISAVYRLNFTLSVDNGGTVSLWQDRTNLGADGAFDPSEDISLVATESRGYNFVGWFTADGEAFGEKGVEKVNSDGTSTWTYTFKPSLQPLSLKAVFEGDEVGIIVDSTSLTGFGSILSFKVNGTEQDISSEITARVGSQIQIQVESEYGYGVIWEGVTPKYDISTQTYVYTVLAEDLTSYEGALHKNVILLKPVGTSSHISFRFDVRMGDDSQSTENAGSLVYRDPEGISHEITTGYVIEEILYGNTFFLEVVLQPNYRVGYVAIVAQGIHILDYDTIGSGFNPVSSRIEIQTSILNEFKPDLSEEISVIINFERDIWTDYSSEELSGAGTEADPYIIATNEDLAFMAYMINNEGNEHYASAYYLLVDNLDMTGKFWEPIGTEENPFAGTFNFDVYTIENLEHYMVYSNPTTSYNGLFWFMTDDAQILITNNALIIGLSVAGGIILLVLLILLIILLVRRRNKKKMEELANS